MDSFVAVVLLLPKIDVLRFDGVKLDDAYIIVKNKSY